MDKPARTRGEPPITEVFFISGAVLVVIGLIYAIKKSWPSLDPLALATLIGIGLLLVVVCERLRALVKGVAEITRHLERLGPSGPGSDAGKAPPSQ
jgi:hypothetical protein